MLRLVPLALTCLVALPAAADTIVAARTIRAQALVTLADVTQVPGDTAGTYATLEEVAGLEARVALYAGRPVKIDDLGPPAIVDRNQIVTLVFSLGRLNISADGRALARAGVGDALRVMNLASRQIVTGFVRDDGTVSVGPNN